MQKKFFQAEVNTLTITPILAILKCIDILFRKQLSLVHCHSWYKRLEHLSGQFVYFVQASFINDDKRNNSLTSLHGFLLTQEFDNMLSTFFTLIAYLNYKVVIINVVNFLIAYLVFYLDFFQFYEVIFKLYAFAP